MTNKEAFEQYIGSLSSSPERQEFWYKVAYRALTDFNSVHLHPSEVAEQLLPGPGMPVEVMTMLFSGHEPYVMTRTVEGPEPFEGIAKDDVVSWRYVMRGEPTEVPEPIPDLWSEEVFMEVVLGDG